MITVSPSWRNRYVQYSSWTAPPTGNKVEADYVYVMEFDGDRIRHMTKIWNDGISLTQLGWG